MQESENTYAYIILRLSDFYCLKRQLSKKNCLFPLTYQKNYILYIKIYISLYIKQRHLSSFIVQLSEAVS